MTAHDLSVSQAPPSAYQSVFKSEAGEEKKTLKALANS